MHRKFLVLLLLIIFMWKNDGRYAFWIWHICITKFNIYLSAYTHAYTYICICVYMYICVYVFLCIFRNRILHNINQNIACCKIAHSTLFPKQFRLCKSFLSIEIQIFCCWYLGFFTISFGVFKNIVCVMSRYPNQKEIHSYPWVLI